MCVNQALDLSLSSVTPYTHFPGMHRRDRRICQVGSGCKHDTALLVVAGHSGYHCQWYDTGYH